MNILFFSYHFPPYNTVGAVRPGKLVKYLHARGHRVHVVTACDPPFAQGLPLEIPLAQVHAVPGWSANAPLHWLLGGRDRVAGAGFQGAGSGRPWVRRLGACYKTLLHWPDAEIGWAAAALAEGRKLLSLGGYDLIYVSAPPFSALRAVARLARESGLPWVAEFRDLWADNHAYPHPAWRRAIERRWEARLLRGAVALVTVSPPLAATLARYGKPVWEVRNGFDPDDLATLAPLPLADAEELRIVYTGSVYVDYHDVDVFCAGFAQFVAAGGNARVQVAGRNVAPLARAAQRHGVAGRFELRATVPRSEALALQRAADVLLMFLWQGGKDGIYTTKLFEYAGAGRPVLAVGAAGNDVACLIREATIGEVADSPASVAALLAQWQQRKRAQGSLAATPAAGCDFTRAAQFARLEAQLETLLAERGRGA